MTGRNRDEWREQQKAKRSTAIPAELLRTLKHKVRSLVDDLEAKHQPVDPRRVAEQVLIAHAPIAHMPLADRAAIVDELADYARSLREKDTHA